MFKVMRKIVKNERGASLVEALVALGLLGLIATTFLMAIFIATKSIAIADEKATAESLARTQMEYVKQQEYIYDNSEAEYIEIGLSENPHYSIWSVDHFGGIVEEVVAVPWNSQSDMWTSPDDGLQKITLKI